MKAPFSMKITSLQGGKLAINVHLNTNPIKLQNLGDSQSILTDSYSLMWLQGVDFLRIDPMVFTRSHGFMLNS